MCLLYHIEKLDECQLYHMEKLYATIGKKQSNVVNKCFKHTQNTQIDNYCFPIISNITDSQVRLAVSFTHGGSY